jgi:Mrp family chromosome partitioning ATPase
MNQAGDGGFSPAPRRSFLRARWPWVFFVAVLVMVGAYGTERLQHRSYVSSASIVLGPQMFGDGAEPLAPGLGTAKAVATSTVVLMPAAHALRMGLAPLRAAVSVSNPADTDMLVISAKAASPAKALAEAGTVSQAFCAYQNAPLAAVQSQEARVASGDKSSSVLSVETATIVSPAELPKAASGHSLDMDLAVALVAGLGLGVGAALLIDRYSKKVSDQAGLEDLLGRPVLAAVPRSSPRLAGRGALAVITEDPQLLGAYRALRVRLQDLSAGHASTVVVASRLYPSIVPEPPTAVGLAVSLALSGRRVVLVGADFAGAHIGRLFGLSKLPGLAEALSSATTPAEVPLVGTALEGLWLLPEGAARSTALERFDQGRLARLFAGMAQSSADVIVVDGPALMGSPEALALIGAADQVVLDVDRRRAVRGDLSVALAGLGAHQGRLAGMVTTRQASRRRRVAPICGPAGQGQNQPAVNPPPSSVNPPPDTVSSLPEPASSLGQTAAPGPWRPAPENPAAGNGNAKSAVLEPALTGAVLGPDRGDGKEGTGATSTVSFDGRRAP